MTSKTKTSKTKIHKPTRVLTEKVIAQIRRMIANLKAEPGNYDQDSYPENLYVDQTEGITKGTTCGHSFCAAGHIINARSHRAFLKLAVEADKVSWRMLAVEELGPRFTKFAEAVSSNQTKQNIFADPEDCLFGIAPSWPERFYKIYQKGFDAKTNAGRDRQLVRAFEARWEAFIASDARDIQVGYYREDASNRASDGKKKAVLLDY